MKNIQTHQERSTGYESMLLIPTICCSTREASSVCYPYNLSISMQGFSLHQALSEGWWNTAKGSVPYSSIHRELSTDCYCSGFFSEQYSSTDQVLIIGCCSTPSLSVSCSLTHSVLSIDYQSRQAYPIRYTPIRQVSSTGCLRRSRLSTM